MNTNICLPLSSEAMSTRDFIHEFIYPKEVMLSRMDKDAKQCLASLKKTAHQEGLWGQFFPASWGGKVATLENYIEIGLEEGRTEFAPLLFGSFGTLNAYMLDTYGSDFIKKNFLAPLATGEISSAFAMSEPDKPGSIPATLSCTAKPEKTGWKINGGKWYISNAINADYVTILACTEPEAPVPERFTMFVVPADTPGCTMAGGVSTFGRQLGQGEYIFDNIFLDDKYRLGDVGQGMEIMRYRVGLGRLLRAVHWLGLADRCLELSYQRIHSERGQLTRLADKQLIRQHIFDMYAAIEPAKSLLVKTAQLYDQNIIDQKLINLTKVLASKALCQASDSAIQIYGSEGVSGLSPLPAIYQVARTTRILDGADEALINSVGNELIKENSSKS